jgi:uncharacterized membrane protein
VFLLHIVAVEGHMESRAKLFGHPIHVMLVAFPLGLLLMAAVFDIIRLMTGDPYWSEIAFWMITAGIVTALIAAPFGLIDWLATPSGSRASRIGFLHGAGNILMVMLYAASWWMRRSNPGGADMLALAVSFSGGALAVFTGWLGGELVDRLGVGVDDGAHVDAPSSLSHRRIVKG